MILTIILISDLYVSQYRTFMIVMKNFGYSNKEIFLCIFGLLILTSFFSFLIGASFSYLAIYTSVKIIINFIGIISFGITWWAPLTAGILIFLLYFISLLITTWKIRNNSPSVLIDFNKIN
ncbi:ABC transporter permease [Spiroplasma taiwanense]|uniref:ABC3 transporter permease C-terminal domain-containing protein n=1 Tax=Spiroplasma taiwanense CT-1 TaxID=1276220 RepID=S5MHG9_9MOLU|nr:FtsX-like permease family protein [Spiroplasma taiwanense]AGR41290.1 hypothetical protein STAIW_v1c06720 [Spiroplasma taiwanense CT-1]